MYLFLSTVYVFQWCCFPYFLQVLSLFLTILHCCWRISLNQRFCGFFGLLIIFSGIHLSSISCSCRVNWVWASLVLVFSLGCGGWKFSIIVAGLTSSKFSFWLPWVYPFDIYCGRDESVVQNEVEHIKLAHINLRCGFYENEVQYVSFLVGGFNYMLP